MDFFSEMAADQRRQLVDAQQVFGAWRPAYMELDSMGSLTWNKSNDKRYLYRKVHGISKSLGRETPELSALKASESIRKPALRQRVRQLQSNLDRMAPVNRAIGIARMPTIAAKVIRELDREKLLGTHITVAGTNALYAYEAACGVVVGGQFVATGDTDLLWDTKKTLALAAATRRVGLMGILRRVDKTFVADYGYNATNSDGYVIDLLCPEPDEAMTIKKGRDLIATAMTGIEWLLAAPTIDQIIVGADGYPLKIVVPEPRTYALHKLWLSEQQSRTPVKRPRDRDHARIVAQLSERYLGKTLSAKEMPWLSAELKAQIKPLLRAMNQRSEP